MSLVKRRQYFPRDCSFLCCCPTELLRAWPYWKTRFSRAVSRDGLAFWKEAVIKLPWKRITSVGEKLHSDFPDGIVIRLASRTSSLLGDRTLLPFPILLGTNMIDGAVDALGTLTEPYVRVGRTTVAKAEQHVQPSSTCCHWCRSAHSLYLSLSLSCPIAPQCNWIDNVGASALSPHFSQDEPVV